MKTINLAGRLTRDPEVKDFGSSVVCNFTVAVDGREKVDGEWIDKALFFNCACWGKRGENIAKYLHKGSFIACSGELGQRTYERKDGSGSGTSLEVNVSHFTFGPKTEQSGGGDFSRPDTAPSGSFGQDQPF